MKQTELLELILAKARSVQEEFGSAGLYASHIAAAVTDLCRTKYTGISLSDRTFHPVRFEEERLRYVFEKETRVASYYRLRLSIHTKAGILEEPFDWGFCERIAEARGAEILSADVVFLCALATLHIAYSRTVKTVNSAQAILARLQDTDVNIYDYVVENIEALCRELQKKAAEAAAIRDWKPAAKFAEPEEVLSLAFHGIEIAHDGFIATIRIPKFFDDTDLTLAIHQVDGIYYIRDNRCALGYLAETLREEEGMYEQAVKKVCHKHRMDDGSITGCFTTVEGFLQYLKELTYVARAAIYFRRLKKQLCVSQGADGYLPLDRAQPFDAGELVDMLRTALRADYTQEEGLFCGVAMGNGFSGLRYVFQVESLEDGRIRFRDIRKGQYEGEILESVYWHHGGEEISCFRQPFAQLAGFFGGDFDGREFSLTVRTGDFQRGLFRFFQLAVVAGVLGEAIALPRIC